MIQWQNALCGRAQCPAVCSPHARSQHSSRRATLRTRLGAKDNEKESGSPGGDKQLQDALVEVLRAEMRKQVVREQVQEEVNESYQQGVEELKSVAEEITEKFEKTSELNKMRANLALNNTLADIMQDADEYMAELKKNRESNEADQKEFQEWEKKIRGEQNAGLFFKGLYKADKEEEEDDKLVDKEKVAAAVAVVKEPAQVELRSSWRMYLFSYMVVVLALAVGQDVLSDDPSYSIDVLYTLIAVTLGFNAFSERKLLLNRDQEEKKL